MDNFIAKIKERAVELIIAVLYTPFIILAAKFTPDDFIRRVDPLIWFWLVISLVTICTFFLVYIVYKREKYIFMQEFGILKEKRTGNYFCPSCMANSKKSHLKEYENGWQCMTKGCNALYYKPGKKPEPPTRRVISKGIDNGWIRRW